MYYVYGFVILCVLAYFFFKSKKPEAIPQLLKSAAKWATTAQQDDSPYLSVMHANYACGYLWALKDLATPQDIYKKTGVDFKKFEEHILNVQEMVTQKVIKKCPEFAGEVDLYLSSIAQN